MSRMTANTDRFARALAADRSFDHAVVSYVEGYVSWRRALGGFNKVISSGARQRIMKSVLALHYANATENPDDGATFERLLNEANRVGPCGPRVLRTVISLAQRSGYIEVSQGWFDRRLRVFRPTPKWVSKEAERHDFALQSLALLDMDRTRFATRPPGPTLVALLANGNGGDVIGLGLGEPDEAVQQVAALDGGMPTLMAVAEAWLRGKRIPSHKELGASFRLSASQARKILHLAAELGLVSFDRDGKVCDASGVAQECRRLVAHELALYARRATTFEGAASHAIAAPSAESERQAEHVH